MPDAKSAVTFVGHPDALEALDGSWLTAYIRRTCEVREPNSATEVLGSVVGTPNSQAVQFLEHVEKLESLHGALEELLDPQVELILGRKCADVSKVAHLLRTNGHFLHCDVVALHDAAQQRFLQHILAGDLTEHALHQAAT